MNGSEGSGCRGQLQGLGVGLLGSGWPDPSGGSPAQAAWKAGQLVTVQDLAQQCSSLAVRLGPPCLSPLHRTPLRQGLQAGLPFHGHPPDWALVGLHSKGGRGGEATRERSICGIRAQGAPSPSGNGAKSGIPWVEKGGGGRKEGSWWQLGGCGCACGAAFLD